MSSTVFFSAKSENKKLLKSYEMSHQTFSNLGRFSGVLIVNFAQVLGVRFRDVFSILLNVYVGTFCDDDKTPSQMFDKVSKTPPGLTSDY